jgi:hypothetical protein
MNRAFLILAVPAVVISLAWITVGWGLRASVPAGITVLVVAGAGLVWWRQKRGAAAGR